MNRFPVRALASLLTLLGLAACQSPTPHPTARSITVFPVVLGGTPNAQAATVVGSLLERGGMPDVQVGDARFVPDPAHDLAGRAAAFTAFVKQQKLATERAPDDDPGSPKKNSTVSDVPSADGTTKLLNPAAGVPSSLNSISPLASSVPDASLTSTSQRPVDTAVS